MRKPLFVVKGPIAGSLLLLILFFFAGTAPAEEAVTGDAQYWFNKGALVAVYGNNEAAVKYFRKAVEIDPQFTAAIFQMGIAQGQLGNFEEGIRLTSRAIEMDPKNGMYHYGRGRIFLLAGEGLQAAADFEKAASLGDLDAIEFLKSR